jgi:hypothetical protein
MHYHVFLVHCTSHHSKQDFNCQILYLETKIYINFEVLTGVTAFWEVTRCSVVELYVLLSQSLL